MVQAFVVPALRTEREERSTRFLGGASEIKGRATRNNTCNRRYPKRGFSLASSTSRARNGSSLRSVRYR